MDTKDTQNKPQLPPNNSKNTAMVGLIVILFGIFLLLKNLGLSVLIPSWILGWQTILIAIGLVIGVNSNFEKKSAVILIGIGSVFLLKEWLHFSAGKFLVPMIAIGIGYYLIKRNRQQTIPPDNSPDKMPDNKTDSFDWDKRITTDIPEDKQAHSSAYGENYLKVEAILGSSKKIILTKNLLGGTMTNILGSTEINLLQADFKQPIAIDIFQLFGSTKIIVPPHWVISTQVSSVLSENDDRRVILHHPYDESKKLYITGTSILGNITIKNS